MRRKLFTLILFQILLIQALSGFGQCPTVDITFPDTLCLNEPFDVVNNSGGGFSFDYEFCAGDLSSTFSLQNVNTYSQFNVPLHLSVVYDGVNWYGFVANTNSSNIFRLDFGNSLSNNPILTDLGNISSLLQRPNAFRVINEGGNWYGLVSNITNQKILRIDFGSNLNNNSPTAVEVADGGGGVRDLIIENINSNYYVILTNAFGLQYINFGNSITNIPAPEDITFSSDFEGANLLAGISVLPNCDQWYGVASSLISKKLYFLSFGSNPTNDPAVQAISDLFPKVGTFAHLSFLQDKGEFWVIVVSREGDVYRVNLGNDLEKVVPVAEDLGNFGTMDNLQAFAHGKQGSAHFFLTLDFSGKTLYRLSLPNDCSSSIETSSEITPVNISYSVPGKYFIDVVVSDNTGRVDYYLDSIYVREKPKSIFHTSFTCSSQPTEFMDVSELDGNSLVSWQWDFDDPTSGADNTSNLQNPIHAYTTPGDYNVNLKVTDDCGQMSDTTILVKIVPENDLQPDFSTETVLCSNDSLLFTDISTFTDDPPVTWFWNFGDPASSENTSTFQNPKHYYASPGNYDVEMKVTGTSGCEKTIVSQITVVEGPSVAYSFANDCLDNSIVFTNNTTGSGITGYTWEFGDGVTSNVVSPTHTFADPGDYTVMLTVDNDLGCSVTNTQIVTVHALPQVAFINELACSNGGTQFFDQTTVEDANITTWLWDFGDGNTSGEKDPIHIYQNSGSFPVRLTTTSNFGCTATLEKVVDVIAGPTVDFSISQVCLGEETKLEDLSETTDGSAITSWFWEIDGQVFTEQNPSTTFAAPGTYNASLTVTSSTFCTATITKDVVINPLPVADFSIANACVNDIVRFADGSVVAGDEIATYNWNFGNLGNSSEANPVFIFKETGDYNITLTITTTTGCESTVNRIISILDRPEGAFTTDVSQGPSPLTVNFQNNSTGADNFEWDFGNGESSLVTNPIFTYTDLGLFEVQLVASTDAGCTDTVRQSINIVEPLMDLALENITTLVRDGKTRVSLDIRNNGTLFVNQVEITLEIGSEATVTETLNQIIAPGELIVYPLSISVANRNTTPFLCATLNPLELTFPEENLANNIFCINLNERSNVVKPFPNPTNRVVKVGVVLEESQKVTIIMVNAIGKSVLEQEIPDAQKGLNEFNVDVSGIGDGIYWLKLQHGSSTEVFRVIVVK